MENISIDLEKFKTVKHSSTYLFKDRGSKFISFVFPINSEAEFKDKLQEIKEIHPSCNHHCYAFRLNPDGQHYRYSDDGEPNNSAGKPIYGQLLSSEITNVGAVVARYFGGTKLGVGGLINAYKEATRLAIEANSIITTELKKSYLLNYNYDQTSLVNQAFSKFEIEIVNTEFNESCEALVKCTLSQVDDFEVYCSEINLELKSLDQ
ncbi:IMPACT family protein [Parvicella tangerina]|uniref:IMPACT family member YigZ n=1 Tax=Parvicella tangerina TaxID=2829795 RepID=A0A916NFY8_9FLAO|nr:YigZ family protein [Parvicella tangerina]CAG5079623.1 IMPACT family member YigZ [Parvicella tangerina]